MAIRDKSDLISGVCIGAFGIYVVVEASRLAYSSEYGPGPGFLPLWLGIGLLVLALSLVLISLFGSSKNGKKDSPQLCRPVVRALSGWLGLMLAIALLPWLGFGLSLALLAAFLIRVLERRPFWTALSAAIGLAAAFHLIFVVGLGLSLPLGPWGF